MNPKQKHNKKHFHYRWEALLLLLLFAITIFPAGIFHNHHNKCEVESECSDTSLCHITIYHADANKQHCPHPVHISPTPESCKFCSYPAPRVSHEFVVANPLCFEVTYLSRQLIYYYTTPSSTVYLVSTANKGPPLG